MHVGLASLSLAQMLMPVAIQPAINTSVPGLAGLANGRTTSASGQNSFAATLGAQIPATHPNASPVADSGTPPENNSGTHTANVLGRKNSAKNNSPTSFNLSPAVSATPIPPVSTPQIPNAYVQSLNIDLGKSDAESQPGVGDAGDRSNPSTSGVGEHSTTPGVLTGAAETQTLNPAAGNNAVTLAPSASSSTSNPGPTSSEALSTVSAGSILVGDDTGAEDSNATNAGLSSAGVPTQGTDALSAQIPAGQAEFKFSVAALPQNSFPFGTSIQSSTDSEKTESEKASSEKALIISAIANSIANPNELATPSSALRSNVAASLAGSFPEARQNLPRIATSAQPDAKPVTTATFERPSVVPLSAASPVPISTSFRLSNPATTVSVGAVSVPERPGINEANNISQPANPTSESTGKNSPTTAGSPSTPAHAPTAEPAAAATASPTNVSQLNPVSSSGIASGSPQPVAPAAVPLVNPATASQTTSGQPTSSTMPKSSGNLPASPSDSPPNVPAIPETSAAPAPGPVQMAQMVSKAGQSEMRIGLNTSAFGSVEVRTTVHANDVGVVIGSEKGDLHALLANEIPGIANSLQQQNLRLSQVNFQQGAAFSGNQFSGGGSQARYSSPTQTFPSSLPAGERSEEELPTYSEIVPSRSSGLSILA